MYVYFLLLIWSFLSLKRGSYFYKKLRKDKFQFWWLCYKMGCWQSLTDFVNFDNICHVILKKKLFLSGIIVWVTRPRKDITVTFVSSGFHAGRFTVECTEYDDEYDMMNMIWMYRKLFSYYDIFMYLSSNFTLDLRLWIHRLAASHLLY